jgi:hypothetical protein
MLSQHPWYLVSVVTSVTCSWSFQFVRLPLLRRCFFRWLPSHSSRRYFSPSLLPSFSIARVCGFFSSLACAFLCGLCCLEHTVLRWYQRWCMQTVYQPERVTFFCASWLQMSLCGSIMCMTKGRSRVAQGVVMACHKGLWRALVTCRQETCMCTMFWDVLRTLE